MTEERFAVVGFGSAGRRHVRLLRRLRPSSELVLVSARASKLVNKIPEISEAVTSVDEAVQLGLSAAIVASPATEHIEQALTLCAAQCPTLIEKPIATHSSQCGALIAAINENASFVSVGYQLRFDVAAKSFSTLLSSGHGGAPLQARIECGSYLPEWRSTIEYRNSVSARRELGGGVLLELSHEVDYCRWLFGDIEYVQGNLSNSGHLAVNVEEAAHILLRMRSGLPVVMIIDFHRRLPRREVIVQTTTGELQWNVLSQSISTTQRDGPTTKQHFDQPRNEIFLSQLEDFLDRSRRGQSPVVGVADACETLRVIDAIRLSDETGERVYL